MNDMDSYYTYRGDLRAVVGDGAVVRFVTVHPDGHPTAVYALDTESDELTARPLPCGGVAITADGDTFYVAGTDRRIYTVAGNKPPVPLGDPLPDPPTALAPASDNRLAVVAGPALLLLAAADGRVLQTLPLPEPGTAVAADPSGRWLAVGTEKGTVVVFDGHGKPEFEPGESAKLHDGAVTALLFEAEELRFFSTGADGRLLNTHARGALEPEDKGRGNAHAEAVTALVHVPAGDRLVTGSRDRTLKNWPRAGAMKPATLADKVGRVVALARVTPHDEPRLAVLCDDNTIRLISLDDTDGRFDEKLFDFIDTAHGALDWARHELASTWDARARLAAVKELAGWADAASLDLLAAQIGTDADSAVRVAATKALGAVANPRAVALLEPLVGHADDKVRVAAFEGLRRHLGTGDFRPLDLALATGKPEVGVLAVTALEGPARADDQSLAKLVAALDAPAWDVRKRAVAALEAVFDADPERATLVAVGAAAGDVRALALRRAFDRKLLDRPAVRAAVRRRLEDDDGAVRQVAFLLALEARPGLATALRSRDPELHRQLGELEKSEAKQPVARSADKLEQADYDVLLQATASRALDTCLRGANALARLGDGRAFPLLLQLSREEPEAARVDVCRALAALGDRRAVARLRSLLLDPAPAVRDAAYTAVAALSDSPLSAAEAGLTAAAEDVRRRGLQTLLAETKAKPPQSEGAAGWGLFVRALNDPAPAVRREAFKAAVNQGVAGGGEGTLRFARRSVHPDVRREVLTEVQAQAGEGWATPLLYEFFDDPDPGLRAEAFELATRKTKELAPLEAALRSKHPDARLLAVDALHKKHTPAAEAVLLAAVADPDPGVRTRAAAALVADDARAALTQALAADHPDVRVTAAAALARVGDPAAGPVLRRLAFAPEPAEAFRRDEWRTLAVAALDGLRSLADPGVFPDLLALADSPHAEVRAAAAAALVTCAPADGVERVRPLLAHADPAVRTQAAATFAARGDATVHPLLGDVPPLDRLAFQVAAVQLSLADALDAADEAARRAALLVHLLLERAGTDGVPDLLLQALSAKAPRVRLAAARGLEAFHDPAAFAAFVVATANDRGDDPTWKLTADTLDPLAAVLRFAPPLRRWEATRLLGAFADKEPDRFLRGWGVFARRYAADVAAAVAKLKPVRSKLSAAELRELAFGAYVGLVREQGSGAAGPAVVRARQTALTRLAAIAVADPGYAAAARPVFTQALGDPNQPVRLQAFDHLQALGLTAADLGAEALEAGHTDLGVKGLERLTAGTADGQAVLERVMLSRTDDLATEAARLLAKSRGWVPVAAAALEAVAEPLRAEAVRWLAERTDDPAAVQALRGAVASRYRPVREAAAFALAVKKDPAAFEPLAALLREATDEDRQEQLAEAFTELGDPRAVDVLIDRVETDPTGTAAFIPLLREAARFRVPASADRLLALAVRRKEWQRAVLYDTQMVAGLDQNLAHLGLNDVPGIDAAMDKQHPRHLAVAAKLLEAWTAYGPLNELPEVIERAMLLRGPEVDPPLASLAAHADEKVRIAAVAAVGWRAKHRGGPAEPLLAALRHKHPLTQLAAAVGLARAGRAEGLPVLLSGIEAVDDYAWRSWAVASLGELADPRAVDALLRLAADDGHALQESAVEAVGHLGRSPRGEEIGKLLERLARSPQCGVAARAVAGLRHLNTAAGWRLVRERVRAGDWQVRREACRQLGFDADPSSRDLLLDVLRTEPDSDVVAAALDAALKRFGADSVEPYYAVIQHPRFAGYSLGAGGRNHLDVVCEKGDPLRLLELFPRLPAEAQGRIEASLSGRAAVPIEAATAALTHADAATVRLAARLLAGAADVPAAAGKALAAAVGKWWAAWRERRAGFDRTGDREPLDAAAGCLQSLFWAGGRAGVAGDELAEVATARADDPLARPVRLDALRTLAALPKPPVKTLEALADDADAEVRTLAAAVLAKRDPKRAAASLDDHLSDRPTFARVLAAGVPAGDAVTAAASKPHQQSVALPALVAGRQVATLSKVAADRKAAEPARLGAVEGLGFMADPAAEAELAKLTAAADEDVRKAAWKALRRSKRARTRLP